MTGMDISVVPSGAALGATIQGLDLSSVGELEADAVRRAWLDHQVLLFRDQRLDDAALIAFHNALPINARYDEYRPGFYWQRFVQN